MARTSLSLGLIIRDILSNDADVMSMATAVYPIMVDKALLPYVVYTCDSLDQTPVKSGLGADQVQLIVYCYAKYYEDCVNLAEAVRAALDHKQHEYEGLIMRSCTLTGAGDGWNNDAYLYELRFTLRI